MKKEFYSAPEALVIELVKEDIVTASEENGGNDNFYGEEEV